MALEKYNAKIRKAIAVQRFDRARFHIREAEGLESEEEAVDELFDFYHAVLSCPLISKAEKNAALHKAANLWIKGNLEAAKGNFEMAHAIARRHLKIAYESGDFHRTIDAVTAIRLLSRRSGRPYSREVLLAHGCRVEDDAE